MKEKLAAIAKAAADLRAEAMVLLSKAEKTKDDLDLAEKKMGEAEAKQQEYALMERSAAQQEWEQKAQPPIPVPTPTPIPAAGTEVEKKAFVVPARSRVSRVTAFTGDNRVEKAYRFGRWFQGAVLGHGPSKAFCTEHGIELKAHLEGVNEWGGFLVPDEFSTDMIDLREQYGIFRQFAKVVPMASDTKLQPRRTGGLTAYFVGEADAITASTKGWDQVSLTAKKLGVLTKISSELTEDSVVDVANDLAAEISYAFANKEDECGFNGDGTSSYGGIVGIRNALLNLSGTIANIAGLVVGAGNAYSELVLKDFENVTALLPQYADTPNVRWFCHRQFYFAVMLPLALAAGGTTTSEILSGIRTPTFLGYPVTFAQVLPKVEGNSQVCVLLGDLSLATKLGDRRQVTIATSEHADFASDQINIRGTERIDIKVHDVGNASATAASRVPGTIVGLITAAS